TTYMVLNVAAGIEGFLQSPSYRPTFRVPWYVSIVGALGCIAIMFLINAIATVLAALIVLGIYLWLERQEIQTTWGDVRQGIWLTLVRAGLFNIADSPDPKNWRPHLLVLSGAPTKRWHLIEMAAALTHGRGLITVASILPSGSRDLAQQETMGNTLREYLERRGIRAFVKLTTAQDPFAGSEQLIESYGIGPLVPNTVLLGDTENANPTVRQRYCDLIAKCHRAKRNVVIFRSQPENLEALYRRQPKRIDVWWGGLQSNGGLMLILAYLLRNSWRWRSAEICLKLVVADSTAAQAVETNIKGLIETLRIGAKPEVIVAAGRPFDDILNQSSASADIVFLGLATPNEAFPDYYQSLQKRTAALPPTIFVLASEELAFAELLQKE
ncbi:MAG: Na-K-Cl cotransporter, partial [Leptolyngbya sp. SIO4C1]|nr:Na-K-Cl cotransporter [Leptolyngbya sp. SIO4C1]